MQTLKKYHTLEVGGCHKQNSNARAAFITLVKRLKPWQISEFGLVSELDFQVFTTCG